jgi:hypothetical protein
MHIVQLYGNGRGPRSVVLESDAGSRHLQQTCNDQHKQPTGTSPDQISRTWLRFLVRCLGDSLLFALLGIFQD